MVTDPIRIEPRFFHQLIDPFFVRLGSGSVPAIQTVELRDAVRNLRHTQPLCLYLNAANVSAASLEDRMVFPPKLTR